MVKLVSTPRSSDTYVTWTVGADDDDEEDEAELTETGHTQEIFCPE